jgi:Ca2+-binding RTX toxin-like protein
VGPPGQYNVVPQIDALPDGGFLLTFASVSPGITAADTWSQRYDAQGLPLLAEVRGGRGDDRIDLGGDGGLQGAGGAGDDTYLVNAADDRVVERAGDGTDTVQAQLSWTLGPNIEVLRLLEQAGGANGAGNAQSNTLQGNASNNVLEGLGGADRIDGGAGVDTASYAHAPRGVTVDLAIATAQDTGGAGRDTLVRIENIAGSAHGDVLSGDDAANEIDGGGGADTLGGRGGADTLHGGGADTLRGGSGGDYYFVAATDVVIEQAGGGRDVVLASGSFTLPAAVEYLYLMGKGDADGTGNTGANRIVGNAQENLLAGGAGADTLQGGDGADTLSGGAGADLLKGGAGADAFRFDRAPSTAGVDVIADFAPGDRIELDREVFAGLGAGSTVAAGRFVLGLAAVDADDRLIYDSGTGALYYDADGTGVLAAVQIARLGNVTHPLLAADDLRLVD